MGLMTSENILNLWQDTIKTAENRCAITLNPSLESYLITLLMRYSDKPELAQQIFAKAFLQALQLQERQRQVSLQHVGDQCLLFAGLFPRSAAKKHVKVTYFVDLGRSAYAAVSRTTNDLFSSLAVEFIVLMDVLQSIRDYPDLMPIEAFDQWNELGSQRALKILQEYTNGLPVKIIKR